MDFSRLRNVLGYHVVGSKDAVRHADIPAFCEQLGLGEPIPEEDGTKAQRLSAALTATPDQELPAVAERFLVQHPPSSAKDRNILQDLIWPLGPTIAKRYRREISRALDITDLFRDAHKFDKLLAKLFILSDDLNAIFVASPSSLQARIEQHVHRNPGDWDVEDLFNELEALDATDTRFALLLEGFVSPEVMPDLEAQRHYVELVNPPLANCGLEFRETGERDGYPVFTIVSAQAVSSSRPKNLIFASHIKPDLRFRDAVNNDIEIVTNVDKVLVYDRPITPDGIRWCDLQSWWKELHEIDDDEEAKKSLYVRLRDSLPDNSPPQRLFFESYHAAFGKQVPLLPALLPEVWLHWDPQTVKQRGVDALIRSRMDFLMLLPRGIRVVVEIDGQQHYSVDGRPDSGRYAKMVAADRDLKLDGYHVFRFGGAELQGDTASTVVSRFYQAVFHRFGVEISTSDC